MNNWRNIYKVALGRGTRTIMPDGRIIAVPYHGEAIFREPTLMADLLVAHKEFKDKETLDESVRNGDFNLDKFMADKGMIMYGEESNNTYYVRFSKPTGAALRSLVTLLPRMGRKGKVHVSIIGKDIYKEDTLSIDEFMEDYL